MMHFFIIDGHKFSLTDKTLEKYKESLLYTIANKENSTVDFIAKNGSDIYIDMDSHNFYNIIKLMRGYSVPLDDELIEDIKKLKLDVLLTAKPKHTSIPLSETSIAGSLQFIDATDKQKQPNIFMKKNLNTNINESVVSDITDNFLNSISNAKNITEQAATKKTIRPKKIDL